MKRGTRGMGRVYQRGVRSTASERQAGPVLVSSLQFRIAVGGKQPGLRGTADAATTMVLTAEPELSGAAKALAP